MNLFACRFLCALFLAAVLNGCGGCQPGSAPEEGGSGGAQKSGASKAAPAAGDKKPGAMDAGAGAKDTPVRGPQTLPTARDLPTMKAPPHAAAPGGGMAPGDDEANDEVDTEEEPEEADCSVIADAEPDYGEPPLTVHFSVDYECTEGSAQVSWDFGDKTGPSSDDNPIHVYRDTGEFTAVVTVRTSDGAIARDEIDITVEAEGEGVPDVEPENP